MTAGRLFFSDRYGYRFCVAPQRNKKHDNQLNHTSHLLSDGVLTAACPWYYTCKYYNAYVAFCREPSQSLDSYFSFKRPKGMGQAGISIDHRGSSSPGHGEELTRCGGPPPRLKARLVGFRKKAKAALMRKNTVHALTYADGTGIILIG